MPRRSDVVRKLRKAFDGLKPNLIAAGVDGDKIDGVITKLAEQDVADIEAYLERLATFKTELPYLEFVEVYRARGPEWWKNMANLGETNLRPHKLLREKSRPFRSAWRKFNASKNKETELDPIEDDSSGVSVRSEG